ncbi:hypothetical protein ACO9S2_17170 [Nitrospira sp. NS4]|uniref:hypothetical protein n=1 Tax=Nitrospira sp. NS4 TaxID=3414498 RepID=UPI003C2FCBEB
MMRAQDIDQAIIHDLTAHGTCQVEDILRRLTGFTWNQVFSAIDRMSRDGRLALQRSARFGYDIAVTSGWNRMQDAGVSR